MTDYLQARPPCNIIRCMKAVLLSSFILGVLVYTQSDIFEHILKPKESCNSTYHALIQSTANRIAHMNVSVYPGNSLHGEKPNITLQMHATTQGKSTHASIHNDANHIFHRVLPRDIKVLITMFTTFISSKSKEYVQSNTLRNWAQFQPKVRLILFSTFTTGPLIDLATELGWIVRAVPKVNEFGTPYLKEMYQAAMKMSQSHFYGYINGDILFTEALINTLQVVSKDRIVNTKACSMVIGIRTNVNIDSNAKTPFYKFTDIEKAATERGVVFQNDAQDYFMMACPRFPWKLIPDLVIGRPAYDNYLVAMATKYRVRLVDATPTILALHQTDLEGNYAGNRNIDKGFNKKKIGPFDYSKGIVECAVFYTRYVLSDHHITILQRPEELMCRDILPYRIQHP